MLPYVLAGVALGAIYAIASAGLVVTYTSTGILNFAFGSMAYVDARFYYWANTQKSWPILPSAALALLVVAPLLGVVLHFLVFRHLTNSSTMIKIVATIGLSVALPPLAVLLLGNKEITSAPGLAPQPVHVFHALGTTITLDQVIIYAFLLVAVVGGTFLLRGTDVGLKVRSTVNSPALTRLSGVSTAKVAVGVWATTGLLAGVAGVLLAPTQGLSVSAMTLLMATAFAAVVAARLHSLAAAVGISLLMGIVTDVIQKYLPADSSFTSGVVAGLPFAFMVVFLLAYLVLGGSVGQESARGGALDAAVSPAGADAAAGTGPTTGSDVSWLSPRSLAPLLVLVVVALLPALFSGYWLGLITQGIVLAVALLAITLVTGDGGMTWLCTITFSGGGAIVAAQLNANSGWNPLLAGLVGAAVMAPIGLLLGTLTIRLGELYVALVTLGFAMLTFNLVFTRNKFSQFGAGVTLNRPSFATSDRAFAYFALAVFLVVGLFVVNLRRSSTGLAISAVRWSEPAAKTLGLSVVRLKALLAAGAAFVAGLGGVLIAMYSSAATPESFDAFSGLIWIAVLATVGIRSVPAAAVAGLFFTVLPGVFSTYLTGGGWGQVPSLLFGLGALGVALHPEGVMAAQGRQLLDLVLPNRAGSGDRLGGFGEGDETAPAGANAVGPETAGSETAGSEAAGSAAGARSEIPAPAPVMAGSNELGERQ